MGATGRGGTGGAAGAIAGASGNAVVPDLTASFDDHLSERRSDRDLLSNVDQDFLDLACLEDLDFDGALLRLDHGNHIAALDPVAGLDQPLD